MTRVIEIAGKKEVIIERRGASLNGFVYQQTSPSSYWVISYDPSLGTPTVTIVDSSNRIVYCEIDYPSSGVIEVKSSAPFIGKAIINF